MKELSFAHFLNESYLIRRATGEASGDVWFGVGTFGTTEDAMQGLGNCYRMKVRDTECGNIEAGEFLDREIIAQAINTGSDVANIQFDLQIGKSNKQWGCRRPRPEYPDLCRFLQMMLQIMI